MNKRFILIGDYATSNVGFTLASCSLSPAVYRSVREAVPAMDGAADCSELLTGTVQYESRTLTAILELSEKNRAYRRTVIDHLINAFDGKTELITLPDTPNLYLKGRIHIEQQYNDMAHAAVKVTAVCDPWHYAKQETVYTLTNAIGVQNVAIRNQGRKTVCPLFSSDGDCTVTVGCVTHEIHSGSRQFDDIVFRNGSTMISHSGSGMLQITFREGWL